MKILGLRHGGDEKHLLCVTIQTTKYNLNSVPSAQPHYLVKPLNRGFFYELKFKI